MLSVLLCVWALQYSEAFRDFTHQCLRKEPASRPSAKTLLQHPFMQTAMVRQSRSDAMPPIECSLRRSNWCVAVAPPGSDVCVAVV
jgi:serine/threonine protein kinase